MFAIRIWGYVLALLYCILLSEAQITDPKEVSALLAVKRNLIDPMNHLKNWDKGDPCTSKWTGVVCNDTIWTDGYLHVREIRLLNMNLSGGLAPQLGRLSHLETLDFMWNDLSGSIPKEIGNISSLVLLLLNGNQLSGSFPDELGHLSKLDRLQVDENNISGPIPKSFANLSRVKHIHLNNNSISGQIPPELSNISTLRHLLVDNNNLSGYLPPELSNLTDLRILQLDNNNFNGSAIPSSYGNLSRLAKLSLRNCSLQGAIPDFSRIEHLYYLDLRWNHLTGHIPSNKLSDNMTTIYLSYNHLKGSIPESFSDLPSLQRLSLENNSLTGSVPANIWQNMSFNASDITIDLRNNSLSNILGNLNPPENVTLRLGGNPICNNANTPNIHHFCGSEAGGDVTSTSSTKSTTTCPIYACPADEFLEYVPASPVCFCASPIRIGYRLKSPSFSDFQPYILPFETYVTSSLNLDLYQLSIDTFAWEEGPRLRMYLKLFPMLDTNSSMFNTMNIGTQETRSISKGILAAVLVGAIACAVSISAIVTLLITRRLARDQHSLSRKRLASQISMKIDGVKDFTFKEMALATNKFDSSTQVGRGGYGKVYKGILSDNTVVAIKRAEEGSLQGQREFLTEIKLLSRLHHRNLVSLVGYCYEEGEQMLVYEFMPNGTLRDWISAKAEENLNFGMRLLIALGSAKGILYLHTEANPPVFHRDIKAANILLDSKLNAKVADFGLSLLAPVMDDEGTLPNHVSTVVRGTPGYLDPEYFLTHKLTDKSDVYSLGVVLLELLTGMQPIFRGKNIVREVNMAHLSGMMFSIIDSKMGSYPSECVERFVALALNCCHEEQDKRPSMLDVVRELENILKMMPETDIDVIYPESTKMYSGTSASSSSSYITRDPYVSSSVSGSDLVSGNIPTITPR